jgi:hypothetical protein
MLALAAICAGVALIMVVTQIAEGRRTTGDVLKAAGVGFSPIIGTVLACVIIGIVRLLWWIIRRTLNHLSLKSLVYIGVYIVAILVLLNIGPIWNLAARVAPRLSTVTNVFDLISFIMVTPKLSSTEIKDNILDLCVQTLRLFTFNKINIPPSPATRILGGAILVSLYPLLTLITAYSLHQFSQLIELGEIFNKILPNPFFDYINKHLIEIQLVFMKIWPFTVSVVIISVVLEASVILLSALAEASPEAQKKLEDRLLFCGLVVFAYSRALSMMS